MRWQITRAFALLLLVTLAVLAAAPRAAADAFDRARLAPLASSERLRLFTLARAIDTRQAPRSYSGALRRTLREQGFYHDGTPGTLDRTFRFSPVLAWDDNINGGYYHDQLDLGGLIFDADPANRARAGLVIGTRADASIRLSWAEGRVIDLRAGAELGWSPRHDIGRAFAQVEACARNHLAGWTFADVCASVSGAHRAARRELGEDPVAHRVGDRPQHLGVVDRLAAVRVGHARIVPRITHHLLRTFYCALIVAHVPLRICRPTAPWPATATSRRSGSARPSRRSAAG